MKGPLTSSRSRALHVLVTAGKARVGLGMYDDRPNDPVVTPAGEAWLIDMGYADRTGEVFHPLRPTAAGIAAHGADQ